MEKTNSTGDNAAQETSQINESQTSLPSDEITVVDAELVQEIAATMMNKASLLDEANQSANKSDLKQSQKSIAGSPWDDLIQKLRSEAQATLSSERAALIFYDIGHIYETHLGSREQAINAYNESYHLNPMLNSTIKALVRLSLAQNEYEISSSLMEIEADHASSEDEKIAIWVHQAHLENTQLSDCATARETLLQANRLNETDLVINDLLAEVYDKEGDVGELETQLQNIANVTQDGGLRAALFCQIAKLREEYFQDTEGATYFYNAANQSCTNEVNALPALYRITYANKDYFGFTQLLQMQAARSSGTEAMALLGEAARIYCTKMQDPTAAINLLEPACRSNPQDRTAHVFLADLYEQEKKWTELATVLERALNLPGEESETSMLAFRLGIVALTRLHDLERASKALQKALELMPHNIPALRALGRLYTRQNQHQDLVSLLNRECEYTLDPIRKASLLFRIGHIWETKLGNTSAAAAAYEQALTQQPGFRPAIAGIRRVYRLLGRYVDLLEVYERQLASSTNREENLLLLHWLADLGERKTNDLTVALRAYERIIQLEPSNLHALQALYRLYTRGKHWQELVATLKSDADQTLDPWRRAALLTEAAEVMDRQLGDHESALQLYLEVVDHSPFYQPALMAAGRILQQANRFEDLLKLHQKEFKYSEDTIHRIWLFMKMGRLLHLKLGRLEDAATAYREVLNLTGHITQTAHHLFGQALAAVDQLIHICRQSDNAVELSQLLKMVPLPNSPHGQSLAYRRIAEALRDSKKPELAVEYLRRAITASDDDAAWYQLNRWYAATNDQPHLDRLYLSELERNPELHSKLWIYHKLTSLWAEGESTIEPAYEVLKKILEITPHDLVALHQLALQCCRLGHWQELLTVLELIRDQSEDLDYRLACSTTIAALQEDFLEDLSGAAQNAFKVIEHRPTQPDALEILERHYRVTGNIDGLIHILGQLLKNAQNPTEQAILFHAIASVHSNKNDITKANEFFHLAIETLPSYFPAIRGWRRSIRAKGDLAATAKAYELEAEASLSNQCRGQCFFMAGQIWHLHVHEEELAIRAYTKALERDPLHQNTIDALSALYTARSEWQNLLALWQHVANWTENPRQLKKLLGRIADLQHSQLNDLAGARETISHILDIDPNDKSTLTTLAEICRTTGDWTGLAQVDQHLLDHTDDPILKKALLFELGLLFEEKLHKPDAAIAEYRKILAFDPNDLAALTHLSQILLKEKDWFAAAQVTDILIQRDEDRNRIKSYHLRQARIYAEGFTDFSRAITSCRQALSLDPGDMEATELMVKLLLRFNNPQALQEHLASSLAIHRTRLEREPLLLDSYRALAKIFLWQNATDRRYVITSMLKLLGGADAQDLAFLAFCQTKLPTSPNHYITSEEIETMVLHPDERGGMSHFLEASEEILRHLVPPTAPSGSKLYKLSERNYAQLAACHQWATKTLGEPRHLVRLIEGGQEQSRIEDGEDEPILLLGTKLQQEQNAAELAFNILHRLARIRLHHTTFMRLDPVQVGKIVAAILSTTIQSYNPPYLPSELAEFQRLIDKYLSKRTRRQLESLSIAMSERVLDPGRWQRAMQHSEDRLAVSLFSDVAIALPVLLRLETNRPLSEFKSLEDFITASPRFRHILNYVINEEYLHLRVSLGLAIHSSEENTDPVNAGAAKRHKSNTVRK